MNSDAELTQCWGRGRLVRWERSGKLHGDETAP